MSNFSAIVWRPAPGTAYESWQTIAAIPHFGPFLQLLYSGDAAGLTATLAAIDETLWTTAPQGAAFDRDLATLAGRPLAMVRSRLSFELEGEPIADPLRQQDIGAPTNRRESRERNAGKIDIALPGLCQQDDPKQRQRRPGERPHAVTPHGGDSQRSEKVNRDGSAERDAIERGEERDIHQTGRDAERYQRRHVVTADRA